LSKLSFHPLADQEFADAVHLLGEHGARTAQRFKDLVDAKLEQVSIFPQSGPLKVGYEKDEVRLYFIDRYEYVIPVAPVGGDQYIVLAFAWAGREPDYWVNRLGQ
jgi:plasmid stabilization system protein ParE